MKLSSGNSGYSTVLCLSLLAVSLASLSPAQLQTPENKDGTYTNPVLFADYSDPDVIRVGDDYYLVSSSFHESPGLPILHSTDLVNWTIIGHALDTLPSAVYARPQFGNGVWAPSIRFHHGYFHIYYGDPDLGIYMVRTRNIHGPWETPVLVKSGKGLIDPCPLWDDNGSVYLIHAWAKSRAGFNSMLTVNRMNAEGSSVTDTGMFVYDAHEKHPTMEGPKFYKRNGFYYIFAPAGGVKTGWQTVLRSDSPFGPFQDSIVLRQGSTSVNGPHQGAWVEDINGTSWFLHFQDRGAYGRIVHLQPMKWENDWPVIGESGTPILRHGIPSSKKRSPRIIPQTSDDFSRPTLGLQWQWNANVRRGWYSLTEKKDCLRLFAVSQSPDVNNVMGNPNILLQKFPAHSFAVTVTMDVSSLSRGEKAGLVIAGVEYSSIVVQRTNEGITITRWECTDVIRNGIETAGESAVVSPPVVYLRVHVGNNALCRFTYSTDNTHYNQLGKEFTAQPGRWIGARIGLFALSVSAGKGSVDIHHVEIQRSEERE